MTADPTLVPTPPSPPPSNNDWPGRIAFGVIGLVAGALIAGATFLVVGGGGSFDSSDKEIAAPAKVGDYVKFADAKLNQQTQGKSNVERTTSWNAKSAERLSASFDGAAAVVETYSDDRFENAFVLSAVRATSPFPIYVPYTDPKYLKIAKPQNEEQRFGEVSCSVFNQITAEGQQPKPDSVITVICRRTAPGLTVEIANITGDLQQQPKAVAGLVDAAWQELA